MIGIHTEISPPNTDPSPLLFGIGIKKDEEEKKKISNGLLTPTLSLPQPAIDWGTPNFSEMPNPTRKQPRGQIKVKLTGACTSTTRNSLQMWGSRENKTKPFWHQPWAADSCDLALPEQCHIKQQPGELIPSAIHQSGRPLQANVCPCLGWEETGDLILLIHKMYSQHRDFWKSSLM